MEILRKSFRAYVIAICVFVVLTVILAVLLQFTSYHEDWSFAGLIAALSVTTLFLGGMEGHLVGKKGLVVGILSAVLLILIVLLAVNGVFAEGTVKGSVDISYLIPVLSGAAGGIIGANGRNS